MVGLPTGHVPPRQGAADRSRAAVGAAGGFTGGLPHRQGAAWLGASERPCPGGGPLLSHITDFAVVRRKAGSVPEMPAQFCAAFLTRLFGFIGEIALRRRSHQAPLSFSWFACLASMQGLTCFCSSSRY
ncbi:hypothetical protein LHK_02446 [Laribacter hongkongensis HLHK9]|uniref:Uncharacterized protein n=1 Tax=Laribacter hongkongensis (strain HLHK9) TaxID=557598 RepID=C1DB89_LARHH|nr:hypothetical protein LHK_02446 [Laribacter hongkongensis HLHK9]